MDHNIKLKVNIVLCDLVQDTLNIYGKMKNQSDIQIGNVATIADLLNTALTRLEKIVDSVVAESKKNDNQRTT
jgi:hypothetical protein